MADGEKERPRRHLKPIREGESVGRQTGVAFNEAVNWSNIWAALVVTVGTIVFLAALGNGLNIGGSAAADASFLDTFWTGASLTLALFAGGYFLSAHRPSPTLAGAALQGLVLWGLFISISVTFAAVSSPRAIRFLEARLAPATAVQADGQSAVFILLILGAAILGTMAGTYQFSRR